MSFLNLCKFCIHVKLVVETLGIGFGLLLIDLSAFALPLSFPIIIIFELGLDLFKFTLDEFLFFKRFGLIKCFDGFFLFIGFATASFHTNLKLVFQGSMLSFVLNFKDLLFFRAK